MSKKLIGLIILVLILGSVGAYVLLNNDDNSTENSANTEANLSQSENSENSDTPGFVASTSFSDSFVATINGTTDGEEFNAQLEVDSAGNGHFTSSQGDTVVDFYFTEDRYINCQDTECYELPNGNNTVDITQYTYTDQQFAAFKDKATYKGVQDCPVGTCDVWNVVENDLSTDIYISKSDQRISQIIGTKNNDSTNIVYDFKNVTINIPTNVQTIPGL